MLYHSDALPPTWGRRTSDEETRRRTWHRRMRIINLAHGVGWKRGRRWYIEESDWIRYGIGIGESVAVPAKPAVRVGAVDVAAALRRAGLRPTRAA